MGSGWGRGGEGGSGWGRGGEGGSGWGRGGEGGAGWGRGGKAGWGRGGEGKGVLAPWNDKCCPQIQHSRGQEHWNSMADSMLSTV